VVLQHAVLEFGRLLDVVVGLLQDVEDGVEGLEVNAGNCDLHKEILTFWPFSRASASSMYFIAPTCFSFRLYSLPSTITTII
jgi:hypothetical protein